MKYRVTGWLIAAIVAMLVGPGLGYALEAYMPALIDRAGMSVVTYGNLAFIARVLGIAPQALISALWVAEVARREKRNVYLWSLFGLVFGIIGVAVFFGVVSYERSLAADEALRKIPPNQHLRSSEQGKSGGEVEGAGER